MSEKKKGLIAIIVGGVLSGALGIWMIVSVPTSAFVGQTIAIQAAASVFIILMMVIFGGVMGFGYAFGAPTAWRWVAGLFGLAIGISFFGMILGMLSPRGSLGPALLAFGLFKIMFLMMIIIFSFMPGFFMGIYRIYQERKTA